MNEQERSISVEIGPAVAALAGMADTEKSRPILAGVFFDTNHIVATNGFGLVRRRWVPPDGWKPVVLEATNFRKARFDGQHQTATLTKCGDTYALSWWDGSAQVMAQINSILGSYPKHAAMIPSGKPLAFVALRGGRLRQFVQALSARETVRLFLHGADQPVRFTVEDNEGLLMPKYVDWGEDTIAGGTT